MHTACCGSHAPAIAMPLCRAGHHAGRKEDERDEDPHWCNRSAEAGAPACTACTARPVPLVPPAALQVARPKKKKTGNHIPPPPRLGQASRLPRAITAHPGMHALTQRVAETGPAHRAPLRCAAHAHASHHLPSLKGRPGLHACALGLGMLAVQGRMTLLLGPPVAGTPLTRAWLPLGVAAARRRLSVSTALRVMHALHCSIAPTPPQEVAVELF